MQEHNGGALARLDDMNPTTAAGFDHSTLRRGGTDHPPMDVEHLIGACAGPVSRRVTSSNGFSSRPEPSAPGHPVALASAVLSLEPVTRGALHRPAIGLEPCRRLQPPGRPSNHYADTVAGGRVEAGEDAPGIRPRTLRCA